MCAFLKMWVKSNTPIQWRIVGGRSHYIEDLKIKKNDMENLLQFSKQKEVTKRSNKPSEQNILWFEQKSALKKIEELPNICT